jgi:DNA invertase Pin-like site-specific DNA recombinase
MLRIGYVRCDSNSAAESAALAHAGCQVVRAEAAAGSGMVLESILEFIGEGDQLAVARLDQLGGARAILAALDRLEAHGASLQVLEPELDSRGAAGPALRAALEAVAAVEPPCHFNRRRPAAQEIRALQRAGVGPVEIARRLGVSRMTVWRKLREATA